MFLVVSRSIGSALISTDKGAVVFFKTVPPVEPVAFVKDVCESAMQTQQQKRTRFAKRFSPMTLMARASEEGLEKVAAEVLRPHFHQEPLQPRKVGDLRLPRAFTQRNNLSQFAIRPTLRNHNVLTRDGIIKQVASIVGPGHEVDLRNYDLLIVVEVFKVRCRIIGGNAVSQKVTTSVLTQTTNRRTCVESACSMLASRSSSAITSPRSMILRRTTNLLAIPNLGDSALLSALIRSF